MNSKQSNMTYMKKELLILGLAGCMIALPACSEKEETQAPADSNAISLSAVVPNGSRSAATTTASIKDFIVYAFTEGSMLMDGVKVTREGGSWTYSPTAYWPRPYSRLYQQLQCRPAVCRSQGCRPTSRSRVAEFPSCTFKSQHDAQLH